MLVAMFFRRVNGHVLERYAIVLAAFAPPLCRVSCACAQAGEHIGEAAKKQKHLRKVDQYVDEHAQQHHELERMASREVDLLAAPETPGTHHEEAGEAHDSNPQSCQPPIGHRRPVDQMHDGDDYAGGGRNRHADEVLAIRTARILRLWIVTDVE